MTKNKNIQLLVELEDLLKSHDWYYQYSDDHRVWSSGNALDTRIRKKLEECINADLGTVANALYDNHCPWKDAVK